MRRDPRHSARPHVGPAVLIVLLVPLLAAGSTPPAGQSVPPMAIDRLFAEYDRRDSPGCALAVMRDGHVVYQRGYGMADLEHEAPITPATPFHVASISKQFTAAALLLLVAAHQVTLDDDVRQHLPELHDVGERITLRHLAHHTSGLRDQWELLRLAGWRQTLDLITDDDVRDLVTRQRALNFKPGERFEYSNTGYTLLGFIIRRVSGQTLREFTTARLFAPLGMKHTHFRDDHAELIPGEAYGYTAAPNGHFRLSITNYDTVGATGLMTTVEDLARWEAHFYDPRNGGTARIVQLSQRSRLRSGEEIHYALGLSHGNYRGLPVLEHGGTDAGYRAYFIRFPEQRLAIACLCNLATARPSELARRVADLYLTDAFPAPPPPPRAPVPIPAIELEGKAGVYWDRVQDRIWTLKLDQGHLSVMVSKDLLPLQPLGDGRFQLGELPMTLTFDPPRGRASKFTFQEEGSAPTVYGLAAPYQPSRSDLDRYRGRYYSDELDTFYEVAWQGEQLMLKRRKYPPQTLSPVAPGVFVSPLGTVHFIPDTAGHPTTMLLTTPRIHALSFIRKD